jgi:hypothetical protein
MWYNIPMKKYLFPLLLLITFATVIHSQDVEVRFHERILNTVVQVLAPVSGSGDFDSPLGKNHYTWTLKNPRITVQPDGLSFLADTSVTVSGIPYDTTAKGKAVVTMVENPSKIDLQISQASFALELNVFGNRIHITDIDISAVVNQHLSIDVPTFNQVVHIPAEGSRPAKALRLTAGAPVISFSPPFLVVGAPLIVK